MWRSRWNPDLGQDFEVAAKNKEFASLSEKIYLFKKTLQTDFQSFPVSD